ncbi:hypothetical protein DPMN_040265 [Dreissena polymorpha]|uniref:Uncharacterized protein n=1 Tax=Dreissena polymorpha TaxID=45954 RepID=A0A9D4CUQ0_DREPO|nr:hypothetical protein DPMN_040265 [Dreissena polymorpha]
MPPVSAFGLPQVSQRAHPHVRAEGLQLPLSHVWGSDAGAIRGTETRRMSESQHVRFAYRFFNRRCAVKKIGDRKRNTRKRSLSVTWCSSFREALCITCTSSHREMRIMRGHEIIDLSTTCRSRSPPILRTKFVQNTKNSF